MEMDQREKPLRYCMYIRKSSEEEQAQEKSIPDQIKYCEEYAAREGLLIAKKYPPESRSAKVSNRRQKRARFPLERALQFFVRISKCQFWCTYQENSGHARKMGLIPEAKKETRKYKDDRLKEAVKKIVYDGYSIREAGRQMGVPYSTIAVGFMRMRNGQRSFFDTMLDERTKKIIKQKPKKVKWKK